MNDLYKRHQGLLDEHLLFAKKNLKQYLFKEQNGIVDTEYNSNDFQEIVNQLETLKRKLNDER